MKKFLFICSLILVSASINSQQKAPQTSSPKKQTTTKKMKIVNAVDPICDMKTNENTTETVVYKGKTYGFCSKHCKTEFAKNPEKYLKKKD